MTLALSRSGFGRSVSIEAESSVLRSCEVTRVLVSKSHTGTESQQTLYPCTDGTGRLKIPPKPVKAKTPGYPSLQQLSLDASSKHPTNKIHSGSLLHLSLRITAAHNVRAKEEGGYSCLCLEPRDIDCVWNA